jgi:hypothetical protein
MGKFPSHCPRCPIQALHRYYYTERSIQSAGSDGASGFKEQFLNILAVLASTRMVTTVSTREATTSVFDLVCISDIQIISLQIFERSVLLERCVLGRTSFSLVAPRWVLKLLVAPFLTDLVVD